MERSFVVEAEMVLGHPRRVALSDFDMARSETKDATEINELLRLASLAPREGKSARIVPTPTHVEIANRIRTHREAVTRELNSLSKIGVIERRGDTLLVKDIDRLAEMVHDATGE